MTAPIFPLNPWAVTIPVADLDLIRHNSLDFARDMSFPAMDQLDREIMFTTIFAAACRIYLVEGREVAMANIPDQTWRQHIPLVFRFFIRPRFEELAYA